jgi:hypothetical protein
MASKPRRQEIKYEFYSVRSEWRRLDVKEREADKAKFTAVV